MTAADTATAPPAVVVNRSFVRKYLDGMPDSDAISLKLGRALRFRDAKAGCEIVGVVEDMRQESVEATLQPEIFASYAQVAGAFVGLDPILVVRTAGSPEPYIATLRRLVRDEDPSLALDSVMTMENRVRTSLARPRVYAVLLGGFAGFALTIAGVGLFAVLSYSVAQRSREIGVRTALGATPRDIVGLVLKQALAITAAGLTAGLLGALLLATVLSRFLYGVTGHDGVSFAAVGIILAAVAAVACVVPARRAARVDPLEALRSG